LTITAGSIDNTSGSPVTLSTNNLQNWNGNFTFTGSNPLNLGTGAVTMNNNRIVTVDGNTLTVGGAIGQTGGSRTLTKSGAGTLVLGGNNSYTGSTTVNAGTLALDYSTQDHSKLADTASLILGPGTLSLNGGTHPEVVSSCTLNGAALVTRPGGEATLNLGTISRSAGSTLDVPGGGVVLTPSGDANSVLVAGAGAYATVDGGTDWAAKNAADTAIVSYSSVGTYLTTTATTLGGDGHSDVSSGIDTTLSGEVTGKTLRFNRNEARTITIGTSLALGTGTPAGGGILVTPSVNPASGTTTINGGTLKPGANHALQIIQNSPKGMTIDSIIADGSAASALTKGGSGTLTLGGNNSYTGQTYVTAGKLFINGDQTLAAGAVTVAANATLGGKGIIGGSTTIAAGGKLEFNLGSAPASHDKLELAATRVLTFSGASTLTITTSGGATTGIYTLATAPGGITGSAPALLILPPGWAATASKSGNDLVLNVTSTGGGNTFADWIAGFDVDGQIGANDDFDNDKLGNAVENLLGTSPEVFSQGLNSVSASGGNLVFRHTLSTTPAADLTGSYEWSVNLVDWNASGATASGTTVTFGTPAVITQGTPNLVEVSAVTSTPSARIFARFKAVQMP
jgi:autotransporter-associated beta strand protein